MTNNEVDEKTAGQLESQGLVSGDPEYEAQGIFEAAARPRVRAAITGIRPDGQSVQGNYLGGRAFDQGFEENCEFYRLSYLDSDEIELGLRFKDLLPLLWMRSGNVGPVHGDDTEAYSVAGESPYAILFDPVQVLHFAKELRNLPKVTDIYVVADSEEAYSEVCDFLGPKYRTMLLYRDFLRHFKVRMANLA